MKKILLIVLLLLAGCGSSEEDGLAPDSPEMPEGNAITVNSDGSLAGPTLTCGADGCEVPVHISFE